MSVTVVPNGALTVFTGISSPFLPWLGECRVRPDLPGCGSGRHPALRRLRSLFEARLTMLMILLYAAGGVAIAVYMIAALLRPEKF
jgi:hypothetical protein